MSWEGFWGPPAGGGGGTDPADKARISALENTVYEYEIFESIGSGTSGNVTIPTGATIVLDQYPGAGDCLISRVDSSSGKPVDEVSLSAGGVPVTATLTAGGAWVLSAPPASYPVALIYQVRLSALNRVTLDNNQLVNETVIGVPEAPVDGKQYARKNGAWVEVVGGGSSVATEVGTLDFATGKNSATATVSFAPTTVDTVVVLEFTDKLDEVLIQDMRIRETARSIGVGFTVTGFAPDRASGIYNFRALIREGV